MLATVALHAVALRCAVQVLDAESVGRRALAATVSPVRLVARETPRADDGARAASPARREPPPRVEPHARRAPGLPTASGPARTGVADAPSDADPAAAYRFYSAEEVDVTAEPVSQWNLDPAELDALATSRIVFTLFVGRDGSVLHCSVDEPERLSPAQRKALVARLVGTEMRPARLGGAAVPSRRRVELYTVGGI